MVYFKYDGEKVEKYTVSFDKEQLEKLRIRMIDECSEITHHEVEGLNGPNQYDYLRIRDYS